MSETVRQPVATPGAIADLVSTTTAGPASCGNVHGPRAPAGWVVGADGSYCRRGDTLMEVRSRYQRRILAALLAARECSPGQCVTVQQLLASAWPGERMARRAGANRVYVAINALRGMGLGRDLESERGGYRLAPALNWVRAD